MQKRGLCFIILGFWALTFLTGCGWFSDNPMFPTAKVDIRARVLKEDGNEVPAGILGVLAITTLTSETTNTQQTTNSIITETTLETVDQNVYSSSETTTTTSSFTENSESITETENVTFARVVEFTIHPINAVGGVIEEALIEYADGKGKVISALTRSIPLSVRFLPVLPSNLSGSTLYNQTTSFTLEIFTIGVQNYFQSNGITSGQAIVTLKGIDNAMHAITYRKTIPISCPPYQNPLSLASSGTSPTTSSSSCPTCR